VRLGAGECDIQGGLCGLAVDRGIRWDGRLQIRGRRGYIGGMGILGIFHKGRHERAGFALYTEAVGAARAPVYFQGFGVADTLDGRFDLVALFAALVIRRLGALPDPGPSLAQAVFDAMFADMDFNLRELGVGDMSLPKRMRAMWEAFHGRALAYQAAIEAGDLGGLEEALARNVWRGEPPPGAAAALAAATLRQDAHIATQGIDALRTGAISFLPAPQVVA
jgi:cytochrome b pre-mRNA-processing protein 3